MTMHDAEADDWADRIAFTLPALRTICRNIGPLHAADDCSQAELKKALGAALCAAERLHVELSHATTLQDESGAQAHRSTQAAPRARSARVRRRCP